MADGTAIEWTDATWNPTTGCDRTSPGCDHCYALTLAKRLKAMGNARYQVDGDERTSGPGFGVTLHHDQLDLPLRWRKPRLVFCNSMSDLFHRDVPDAFIAEVFARMGLASWHTFQVLTKRPQRMAEWSRGDATPWGRWPSSWFEARTNRAALPDVQRLADREQLDLAVRWPLPNAWLGTSIESQTYAFRARHLIDTPAVVRFVSAEPLLGPVDLRPHLYGKPRIDWVIVGGESGPHARRMTPDWAEAIRDQCEDAGVAFLFKQAGSVLGKEWRCRDSKGGDWTAFPQWARDRSYPVSVPTVAAP